MDSRLQRLTQTYGVFLTREALAVGYEPKTIRALVRRGEWVHVRHGAYCSADLWHSLDARGRRALVADAVYRSAKAHVVLSHTTAVDRMNVPVWDMPDATHLTRTDGKAGRREAGVVQHRGEVVAEDLTLLGGMWVTSGTRTALDCTMIGDTEHSLVIVNGLLHAAETTPELLQRRLDSMVHWPNSLHTELVLRLADSRCESVGETRTFHLCWSEGLPMPEPQYKIRDRSGRVVARVDFAWPEYGVFLEFDGRVKYEALLKDGERPSDVVLREKRREEMICGLTGWRCIRITWADLLNPARTAARIRAVLAGEPWAA
jgi:Transcriptional regulator, AbiEi antitoxin